MCVPHLVRPTALKFLSCLLSFSLSRVIVNTLSLWSLCWKERKYCISDFMCVCKATGRVSALLPFIYPFVMFLTPRPYCEFRCERTLGLWQKKGSFHIFIWQVLWTCLHTHWAHGSSLPWKGSMFIQNGNVLPSLSPPHLPLLSCTLAERLRAELLGMMPGRVWEWTHPSSHLFSPHSFHLWWGLSPLAQSQLVGWFVCMEYYWALCLWE